MKTPMINATIKKISMLIILICAAIIASTAVARADGILTAQEKRFGDYVSDVLCDYIDAVGVNNDSMTEALEIIYVNTPIHMDMTDSADIINYVVSNYCPRHWPALVAFGEGARSYA